MNVLLVLFCYDLFAWFCLNLSAVWYSVVFSFDMCDVVWLMLAFRLKLVFEHSAVAFS